MGDIVGTLQRIAQTDLHLYKYFSVKRFKK